MFAKYNFYLKNGYEPSKYGFHEDNVNCWRYKCDYQRCTIIIDKYTNKIAATTGINSACLAKLLRMAQDGAIEIVDQDEPEKPYIYRLTKEEAEAIERMRGRKYAE